MTIFLRLTLLLLAGIVTAQNHQVSEPLIWLKGHSKTVIGAESTRLNYYNYPLDNKKTETSIREFSGTHHLFVIYKSEEDETFLSIIGKEKGLFVGSNKVFKDKSISTEGYNQVTGELIDMRVSNIEKGKIWMHPSKKAKVYEVMIFDSYLTPLKANEIRTYLAIKYGLSLSDIKQYVYNDEELWDSTEEYHHNVFGIGFFSNYGLLQKKSVHSKDNDLTVSFSSRRNNQLKRGDFVLLANNGERFSFNADNYNEKQWLCRTNMEEAFIDLYVPLEKTEETTLNQFVAEISLNGQKRFYPGKMENDHIVFRNVKLVEGDAIVKIKGEKAIGKFDYWTDCEQTFLTFNQVFNQDFDLKVLDDNGEQILETTDFKTKIELNNEDTKYFDVYVKSTESNVTQRIYTLNSALAYDELKKQYTINDFGILSIDIPYSKDSEHIVRQWKKEGKFIAEGHSVQIEEAGTYSLISTMGECSVTQQFNVTQSKDFQQWKVYPNPGREHELLSVTFDLEKEQNVKVQIFHIDGKRIKSISYENVSDNTFELGKLPSGQYIVVAYIDALPQIQKIVIQ